MEQDKIAIGTFLEVVFDRYINTSYLSLYPMQVSCKLISTGFRIQLTRLLDNAEETYLYRKTTIPELTVTHQVLFVIETGIKVKKIVNKFK